VARVLVVDDSIAVRKMIERTLETKGFEVLAASSGAEAMERLGSARPDLVICDIVMPDVDGYRICEFVRAHPALSETPVLLLSGMVNNAVLERAAEVCSGDILRKPFTADNLARKVDELLTLRAHGAAPGPGAEMVAPPKLKSTLTELAALSGVRLVALVDREGFLIETAGEVGEAAEMTGALAARLVESAEGIGRDMERGALSSMILGYEDGMVLLHRAGTAATLAVVLREESALGTVRDCVKRSLSELFRPV